MPSTSEIPINCPSSRSASLDANPDATQKDADKVERDQHLINITWGITGAAITAVVIYFAAPSYATDTKNIAIAPNRDGGWSAAVTARF